MRLTQFERQSIHETVLEHFGRDCAAYLFGSRTRDDLRGGDIDLLIESGSNEPIEYSKKLAFRSNLKSRIGDQKIDVLFTQHGDNRPIILEAKREMIRL
ncbi:MAG: nucleotidyltransferase domain-containing protein [Spartobacteria bacterium]